MIETGLYECVASDQRFLAGTRRKARILSVLMVAFLVYYFALLLGAAYFRPWFAQLLWANINVGMAFALSQYLFAGIIAVLYAHQMKKIDACMMDIAKTRLNTGETA